ncbi:MAG TPA: hypothetical protein VF040_17695 [Ktedonobacterales bacterium]
MDVSFVLIGVVIACVGIGLVISGGREVRRSDVTPRDVKKWRARAGKQGFSAPWNIPHDFVVEFVRAWRRQSALRNLALGIAILVFGIVVAVVNALNLTRIGGIIQILFQYTAIVFYPACLIAAYLSISHPSSSQRVSGQLPNQRPLSDYRYPLVPVLLVVLVLGYVGLLFVAFSRLLRGFDFTPLAQVLTLHDMWSLLLGLLMTLVAIGVTEVVVRRIIALPPIPFPPASGWEQVADSALRLQALGGSYVGAWSAIYVATVASSLDLFSQSGVSGWYDMYIVLVMLAGVAIEFLTLFKAPSPSLATTSARPK